MPIDNYEQILIENFEKRVHAIEFQLYGYNDTSHEIQALLNKLNAMVKNIYQRGHNYSKTILQLIDVFLVYENSDQYSSTFVEKQELIITCYEQLKQLTSDLLILQNVYEQSFSLKSIRILQKNNLKFEISLLNTLPQLMKKCNILISRSIIISQKFIQNTISYNEFFESCDSNLDLLEAQVG